METYKGKCFHTLAGVKNVDILGELGALVSSSLPQSSEQTQLCSCVPYHTPIRTFTRHHG